MHNSIGAASNFIRRFSFAGSNPCDSLQCAAKGKECHIDRYGIGTCRCPGLCPHIYRPVCAFPKQNLHCLLPTLTCVSVRLYYNRFCFCCCSTLFLYYPLFKGLRDRQPDLRQRLPLATTCLHDRQKYRIGIQGNMW